MAAEPIVLRGGAVEIRGPAGDDPEAILDVYRQCEDFLALGPQPVASADMVRQDLALSEANGGQFCLVYDVEGRPIGVVDWVPCGAAGRPEHADLSLLMIAAPYRGRGIGREVVALVEREIERDPDITAILSGVQVNNPAAIGFWQRNGYRITGGPERMPDQTTVYLLRKELRTPAP